MLKAVPLIVLLVVFAGCASHVSPEYWTEKGDAYWKREEVGLACYSYKMAQTFSGEPLHQFSDRCLPLREQATTDCLEASNLFCSDQIKDKNDERLKACFLAQSVDLENSEVHNAVGRYLWKAGERRGACESFSLAAEYGDRSELNRFCE